MYVAVRGKPLATHWPFNTGQEVRSTGKGIKVPHLGVIAREPRQEDREIKKADREHGGKTKLKSLNKRKEIIICLKGVWPKWRDDAEY